MLPYVITLTGPSKCGKSSILQTLVSILKNGKYPDFNPILIQKYTTRKFREAEIEAVQKGWKNTLDVRAVVGDNNIIEDAIARFAQTKKFEALNRIGCDLVYEQYGNRYGIKMSDVFDRLKQKETPVIIINDIRAVEDIKTILGKQCCTLFVFRELPDLDSFLKEGAVRNETPKDSRERFEKAQSIYRIYIENIYLFDKLILNLHDGTESLRKILEKLVEHLYVGSEAIR